MTTLEEELARLNAEASAIENKKREVEGKIRHNKLEQRIIENKLVRESADTLLLFVKHDRKNCDDSNPCNDDICGRCQLLEWRRIGCTDEEWKIEVKLVRDEI